MTKARDEEGGRQEQEFRAGGRIVQGDLLLRRLRMLVIRNSRSLWKSIFRILAYYSITSFCRSALLYWQEVS